MTETSELPHQIQGVELAAGDTGRCSRIGFIVLILLRFVLFLFAPLVISLTCELLSLPAIALCIFSMLVCRVLITKHTNWEAKTTEMPCLTVLEATSPKSRGQKDRVLSEGKALPRPLSLPLVVLSLWKHNSHLVCVHPPPLFLGHKPHRMRAYPSDLILTWLPLPRDCLQVSFHSQARGIGTPTPLVEEDTVQPKHSHGHQWLVHVKIY